MQIDTTSAAYLAGYAAAADAPEIPEDLAAQVAALLIGDDAEFAA